MLQHRFSFVAAQLLVKMTSALQKSRCCSATSAAQVSENCSATSVFADGMLQGWGLEGWGLGLANCVKVARLQSEFWHEIPSVSCEATTGGSEPWMRTHPRSRS